MPDGSHCTERATIAAPRWRFTGTGPAGLYGDDAESWLRRTLLPHQPKALGRVFMASGLLEQNELHATLKASAKERYEQISALLGLHDIQGFEDAVRNADNQAGKRVKQTRRELDKAQESAELAAARVKRLEQEAAQQPSVEVIQGELSKLLREAPKGVRVDAPPDMGTSDAFDLAVDCRRLSRRLNTQCQDLQGIAAEMDGLEPEPDDQQLERASRTLEESGTMTAKLHAELREARESLRTAERDSRRGAQLAAAALPMLTERCPV